CCRRSRCPTRRPVPTASASSSPVTCPPRRTRPRAAASAPGAGRPRTSAPRRSRCWRSPSVSRARTPRRRTSRPATSPRRRTWSTRPDAPSVTAVRNPAPRHGVAGFRRVRGCPEAARIRTYGCSPPRTGAASVPRAPFAPILAGKGSADDCVVTRRHSMRGATHAKWVACAVVVALAATACGGGDGDGGGSSDAGAVLSASWGDPQNPLEPANTNEVQGGKVLDMIFRGLKRYDAETGEAQDMIAEKIETSVSQNVTITVKDGWTFSNGEKVTAQSFVDAWNYGASLKNNQRNAYFFGYIEGYDEVHPEDGSAQTADTMSGLKVVDDRTFTVKLSQKFSTFPDTLGYNAFAPLPRAFFDDHAAWVAKPV